MNLHMYDHEARKKSCNASINSDLLSKAKAQGINISKTLEKALTYELKKRSEVLWVSENKKAIEDYNKRISEDGTFAEQEGLI